MTNLTANQISQLQSNGVYSTSPAIPLFTLGDLLEPQTTGDILQTVQTVSGSPNRTVAASYLMRRYGMYTGMQLVQYVLYEDIWCGTDEQFLFGAVEEYGNKAVSIFLPPDGWQEADPKHPEQMVRQLLEKTHHIIGSLRGAAPISPNVLWENVFGFWLWHFHVLLGDPDAAEDARAVLSSAESDEVWAGIHPASRFRTYLQGRKPSELLNTTVRTTCCLSKDVPGLMQCGYCPLKR